ncbi:MAG: DUF2612 domain-containing protein [Ferrovum sp.]|nr:DUF2612 domain-containing protein [Ferrovum sp.]
MFDWQQLILAQFSNSPIILSFCENVFDYIDPSADLETFYDYVWNIATAQGFGLDIWGRIVGVNRVLQITNKYFGFEEAGDVSADPFNQSPFYSGPVASTNYPLSDPAFRTLILAKSMANLTNCSITSINKILMFLFGANGDCYCTDGLDMTMTYTFSGFTPSAVDLSIIENSGVLPRPAGVSVSISII